MNIIIIDDDRKAAETLKSKLTEYDEIEIIGMAQSTLPLNHCNCPKISIFF